VLRGGGWNNTPVNDAFCLKTDIVRFFPNVDHQILLSVLARTIADERLMTLIRQVVGSGEGILADEATSDFFPGDDLFAALRAKGLPIGNLTSQFLANVLLD
jgi:RNA-directed DNA polymerase